MSRFIAAVVEAKSIDQRLVRGKPEQPRLGIARLRQRRQRADLDKAETRAEQSIRSLCVLVEARRDAQRIWKFEAERGDGETRVARGARFGAETQGGDRGPMRRFRQEFQENRQRQTAERAHHGPIDPK